MFAIYKGEERASSVPSGANDFANKADADAELARVVEGIRATFAAPHRRHIPAGALAYALEGWSVREVSA